MIRMGKELFRVIYNITDWDFRTKYLWNKLPNKCLRSIWQVRNFKCDM